MKQDLDRILEKAAAIEATGAAPAAPVTEISMDDFLEYIVCPAKYCISTSSELKSAKKLVRERSRLAINDMAFQSVGKDRVEEKHIVKAAEAVFAGLGYKSLDKDRKDFINSAIRFSNILTDKEYIVNKPLIPITFVHANTVIKSDINLMVTEKRSGFIYPVTIDFSKTIYDPTFNPVIYRAHVIAEHFDLKGSTTNIHVFSLGSDRDWVYEHKKFFAVLRASLRETIEMLRAELFPVRFGWWCMNCEYKGLCHKRRTSK